MEFLAIIGLIVLGLAIFTGGGIVGWILKGALFSMFANAQQISYIKADGAWYQVYDEAGKKLTSSNCLYLWGELR